MELTTVKATSPGAIDRALRDLWAGEGGQLTRACLFNLIVYGTDADLTAVGARVAAEVAEQSPCRSLIVTARPNLPDSPLQSAVTGSCQLRPGEGKQICCEQIMIEADGATRQSLPAMIAALLTPDVRIFVWPVGDALVGDPSVGDPSVVDGLVTRLVTTADRTIIDSGQFSDPAAGFRAATALFASSGTDARQVSDLHWMRCVPWREAFAELVDPPECRGFLGAIDSVRITYQASGSEAPLHDAAQALLYAGWLAGSLHWVAKAGIHKARAGVGLSADASGREVEIVLHAAKATKAPAGMLAGVKATGNRHEAELSLSPDGASVVARCTLADECTPPHAHVLPRLELANLVAGAIQLRSRQASWRTALAAMQPWVS